MNMQIQTSLRLAWMFSSIDQQWLLFLYIKELQFLWTLWTESYEYLLTLLELEYYPSIFEVVLPEGSRFSLNAPGLKSYTKRLRPLCLKEVVSHKLGNQSPTMKRPILS